MAGAGKIADQPKFCELSARGTRNYYCLSADRQTMIPEAACIMMVANGFTNGYVPRYTKQARRPAPLNS